MRSPNVLFSCVLLLWGVCIYVETSRQWAFAVSNDANEGNGCHVSFPESYYVTTGTTIPHPDGRTVAQSGSIYANGRTRQLRVDQFFLGRQHTFISDGTQRMVYVFDRMSSPFPLGQGSNQRCRAFTMRSDVAPLCVPRGFVRDSELVSVRGTPVSRYVGFDREEGPLLQVEYFVYNSTVSGDGLRRVFNSAPWRIQMTGRPIAELKEIAGAPFTLPNWRFFGEPMFDEVVISSAPRDTDGGEAGAVQPWWPRFSPTTVDFYNFVPVEPDPAVFSVPEECLEAKSAWEEMRGDDRSDLSSGAEDSGLMAISAAQRFLIGWSFSLAQETTGVARTGEE